MQISRWLLLFLWLLFQSNGSFAAGAGSPGAVQQEKVELRNAPLKPGEVTSSRSQTAHITARINGHQSIEYLIDARTGQSLELDIQSSNSQASYHVTAPAAPRALHKGRGHHSHFIATLPRDGTYRVLIYLMHSAAQDGESADFALNIRLRNPG